MKIPFKKNLQTPLNLLQILRDRRHEQKSKSLAFAMMYLILPLLFLINLTIALLPDGFFEFISELIAELPEQLQPFITDFLAMYSNQDYSFTLFVLLLLFILYTIAANVRLIIEIANDCYENSEVRTKTRELIIGIVLFFTIGFSIIFLFFIISAGQAIRGFLEINNVQGIAAFLNSLLQMKSMLTVIILFIIFYITFYFAPNVKNTFKGTIVGTLFSTTGLYIGSNLFEIYLARPNTYQYLYQNYSMYILFLFGVYIVCQVIVASIIINSLIFEGVNVRQYHLTHDERGNSIENNL